MIFFVFRSALSIFHYQPSIMRLQIYSIFICLLSIASCKEKDNSSSSTDSSNIDEAGMHEASNALKGLKVAEGLHVNVFATEPLLINPTNMDIDDRGRVWITEAYNYRPDINGNPTRPEGDRIMILEDLNGDGKADTSKVFYQGPEINAPLGICVLDNRVIVSQSPYVWSFYDDNGDDKADRKEILFQQIGDPQHDHGVHAFTFGPDGKLYFNFGNEGKTLVDKNGKVLRDQDGDPIDNKKYRQGMIFRCDLDGTNVEVLGDNFRNNYELAVDSYGGIWQSDNDDDGNRSTRINYIMPYGNYGYTDEMTGAGWSANRTNIENDSLPRKHWHQNDPGVVPNLLHTGAGSPTGMVIYEGAHLPSTFQGQMIHCDAGPNVVRSYPVESVGAGYKASIVNVLKGERDQWFRPADLTIAPDGSLFIADWYDPGVGGHQAGDQSRGRVYRVAANEDGYTKIKFDYSTVKGAIEALKNPNLSVRYKAFMALSSMKENAIPALEEMMKTAEPRMSARAFWVLMKNFPERRAAYISRAIQDNNSDIRMMAVRAAKMYKINIEQTVQSVINDKNINVKREAAIALHHVKSPAAASLWAQLAVQHDGKDRWYLEALGIGAEDNWEACYSAYKNLVKDPFSKAGGPDIIWRARSENSVKDLAVLAANQQGLRYFRAFDFHKGPMKSQYLMAMLKKDSSSFGFDKLVLSHLDDRTVKSSPVAMKKLNAVLDSLNGTPEFIEMVRRYKLPQRNSNLLYMAINGDENMGRNAAGLLLEQNGTGVVNQTIQKKDSNSLKLLKALSKVGSNESLAMLIGIMNSDKYSDTMRMQAASTLGHSWNGEEKVLVLLKNKQVPEKYIPAVVGSVANVWRTAIKDEAETYLPASMKKEKKKDFTLEQINALKADVANGKKVFAVKCGLCHVAGNEGKDFGPALTQIGDKLPREQLYESILNPSKGISFGFEGYSFTTKDGTNYTGIVASKSESDIILKYPGGSRQTIKVSDVKKSEQLKTSMMPSGLQQTMSAQELSDLLGYMEGLK